jgi:1-acyl-sn-glycerol-3-phosphate acyltransferase
VGGGRPRSPKRSLKSVRLTIRYLLARTVSIVLARSMLRIAVDGRENLPDGPYLICFSHGSWADPFVLMAVLPWRPRLYFFGPKEEDMSRGGRNRLMRWAGNAVPYRPGKNDLLDATRRVKAVFDAGGVLAIAGEGRIHAHEGDVLPLSEGAAYFALRAGVPIVPLTIVGMSWFSVGSRVRVRLGQPIATSGRPTREVVEALTAETWSALTDLSGVATTRERPGRFGRWLTELFNEWPEGVRPD